jgi:hypothetical protein
MPLFDNRLPGAVVVREEIWSQSDININVLFTKDRVFRSAFLHFTSAYNYESIASSRTSRL